MPRFEYKSAAELVVGDWAWFDGAWVRILGCATDPGGWTRIVLDRFPLPEVVLHRTVEMPWSHTQPAGSA